MKYLLASIVFFTICFSISFATAHNNVVVIPLHSTKALRNVVTVSPSGGDFSNPVTALDSIADADSDNPYLMIIGPGIYTVTTPLVMKPYVVVAGSGIKNTTLQGAISSGSYDENSAIVVGSTHSSISDLTILNSGGSSHSIGIYNNNAALEISRIKVEAWGGTSGTYGIFNTNFSSAKITDTYSYGGMCPVSSYGVYNNGSSPTLNRVELDAWVDEGLGGNASAIGSFLNSRPQVQNSTLRGSTQSIKQSGGTIEVTYTELASGVDTGLGAVLTCIFNHNGNGTTLNATCGL